MDKKTVERKSNCICGHCHRAFDFSEAAIKQVLLYGKTKEQKVCPYCGSFGFTRADHRFYLDGKQYNQTKANRIVQ